MRRVDVPEVAGVLSTDDAIRSAESIAAVQERSGAIPWSPTGHTDPWDHVESAMALSVVGLREEATRAYEWMRREQRADGSWPMQYRGDVVEDAGSDTNFCAYVAVGVWHHFSITRDEDFLARMWPTVAAAIDFVLDFQSDRGEIAWAAGPNGRAEAALLTGNSSIFHSLRCAVAMAEHLSDPRPEWEIAADRLGAVLRHHEHAFVTKPAHSMDWYYPILAGALRGSAAVERIDQRWDDFVVDGLGIKCVDHQPWVTGAETCELVMALDAVGRRDHAVEQFANMQHLRDPDGAYWTGLVYSDGKRWPVERTTWTTAAVILAADVLCGATPGSEIFR
ncbi:prenyltransferase [Rhodococcoides trifolii]|uniref:Prenyltransferase n=1 Tax=Rhodococcoides trifolii TaxID=908250 RepID=A0A917D5I0_9NOCA|nr:prenyltransferase [Rhodococcus trifolii]GGG13568.1 prenyltransferase [Rhodococcus trifolii]